MPTVKSLVQSGCYFWGTTKAAVDVDALEDEEVRQLEEACIETFKVVASLKRLLRDDKPCGILPTTLDAQPRTRRVTPWYELQGPTEFREAA